MKTKHIYISILFLLASLQNAICQKDSTQKYIWGQAGGSVSISNGTDNLVGFQLGLNYKIKKHVFSVRYYQSDDGFKRSDTFGDFKVFNPTINHVQSIQNLSFMYGLSFGNKYFKIIPMAGLSVGQGYWRNNKVDSIGTGGYSGILGTYPNYSYIYHYELFRYIGAQLGLNLLWTPTKYFGLGLDIFENFHQHSDNGFVVSAIFGRLK